MATTSFAIRLDSIWIWEIMEKLDLNCSTFEKIPFLWGLFFIRILYSFKKKLWFCLWVFVKAQTSLGWINCKRVYTFYTIWAYCRKECHMECDTIVLRIKNYNGFISLNGSYVWRACILYCLVWAWILRKMCVRWMWVCAVTMCIRMPLSDRAAFKAYFHWMSYIHMGL